MNERATSSGWGKDPITQYLDTCRAIQLATFSNKRSQVIDLVAIDDMFRKLVDGAIDPKPFLPMEFLRPSHSAYLTAVDAVMAGRLQELHTLLRACLEQALYGHFIGNDQARWGRWMDRHDPRTPGQKDKWRKEFAHGNLARNLKASNAGLGGTYTELYERTIDYGAHPNERGLSMNSDIVDLPDGGKHFGTLYLQDDGLMLDFSLKSTARVGLCVLRIAQVIYPTRMQANGTQHQLNDMCKQF
jgi:hypothetical protein